MTTNRLAAALALAIVLATAAVSRAHEPVAVAASSRGAAVALPVVLGVGVSTPDLPQPDGAPDIFVSHHPVIRVGQDYTLKQNEAVWELRSVWANLTIGGHVDRDAVSILGDVRVSGSAVIERSLLVWGGNVTIEPGAVVSGDLVVVGGALTAPREFSPGGAYVAVGTPVMNDTLRAVLPWITRGLLLGRLIVPDVGWLWVLAGILFLILLAINTLFDGPVGVAAHAVQERPLSMLFLGILIAILTVPAFIILAATVVGIVVLPFLLCALLVAALVGKAGVARAIGWRLTGRGENESRLRSFAAFTIGSALLVVAYAVPVLGVVVWSLTTVVAVGASAVMLRSRLRQEWPRTEKPPAVPRTRRWWTRSAGRAVAPAVTASTLATEPTGAEPLSAEPQPFVDLPDGVDPGPTAEEPGASIADTDMRVEPGVRAAFLDRVAAFAIDCVLIGIGVLLFDLSRHDGAFPLMLLAYHVAFWAWKGTTLGGVVVGLQIVRLDGSPLRPQDAVIRVLCAVLSVATLGIGCFWMLQDPARQMWHDKIAGTSVLKVPRELVLQ
jgi:uncharacterized RDD family membrane protein YckC